MPPKDMQVVTEVDFHSYAAQKNLSQLADSIRSRESKLAANSGNLSEIRRELNTLYKLKKEKLTSGVNEKLASFREQKKSSDFPVSPPPVDIQELRASTQQEEYGEFTFCLDKTLRADSTHPVWIGYDKSGKLVCAKLCDEDDNEKHARQNYYPPHIKDITQYLKENTDNPALLLHLADIETDRGIFRVFPLVGKDVDSLFEAQNRFTPRQALAIAIEAVDGMRAMHAVDVLHLDFSPTNILVEGTSVKDIDFDSACPKSVDGQFHRGSPPRGFRWLKPPELFEEDPIVDYSSDTYEACVLLYRMVVGEYPYFSGDGTQEEKTLALYAAHNRGEFRIPSHIPESLARILRHGIKPDRKERYRDATLLLNDLLDAFGSLPADNAEN